MCELFGMSCQKPDDAKYSLSALRDRSNYNEDGWGIASYDRDGRAVIEREPIQAILSERYAALSQSTRSTIILGHIRDATTGGRRTENCHPFIQRAFDRDWVFAHNGIVDGFNQHPDAKGDTDSEQVFCELMDDVRLYVRNRTWRGIYPGVKKGVQNILRNYSRDIDLNFILSDGVALYVFSHYPWKPCYYSPRKKGYGNAFVVSTFRPDHPEHEKKYRLPSDRLVMVVDGSVVVTSEKM